MLDGRRYRKEFDGKIFVPYEEGVKAVVEYMKKYSSSFLQREDTGAGWGNPGLETAGADFPHAGSVSGKPDLFYPVLYDS